MKLGSPTVAVLTFVCEGFLCSLVYEYAPSLKDSALIIDDVLNLYRLTGINLQQGYIYFPSNDRPAIQAIVSRAKLLHSI